jgi:transcription-repair coupling factor (superfamily II helicase)
MEPDPWLLPAASQADFAQRLAAIRPGQGTVVFDHAEPAARAWLVALILRQPFERVWLLDPSPKSRDRLAAELRLWNIRTRILPEPPVALLDDESADPESEAARIDTLDWLHRSKQAVVIAGTAVFEQPAPSPDALGSRRLRLETQTRLDPADLVTRLCAEGFERVPLVQGRGQLAVRGGILDLFPWHHPCPLRVEFFDTEIESIREFDVDSQISTRKLGNVEFALSDPEIDSRVGAYRRPGDLVIALVDDSDAPAADVIITAGAIGHHGEEDFSTACFAHPFGRFEAGDFILEENRRERFLRQLADWHAESWHTAIVFGNQGEFTRFIELLPAGTEDRFVPLIGELMESFTVPAAKIAIISSSELFGRYRSITPRRENQTRAVAARASLEEIQEGDLVVHSEYGIGRFTGIRQDPEDAEQLVIEYRDGATLAVPIDQSHLIGRYVGLGGRDPELSKLGGTAWKNVRRQAEESILDYAARLLRLQAERQLGQGFAHPPDSRWMWEFEQSFHFTETPDQLRAIDQAKRDMESPKPMDRLVCGDVGFGKTEVAIRAAFKAVTGGKQVALLCPTTVLAEQHWRTFRERMSDYPIRIDLLNRFRTAAESRATIEALAEGSVDIIIGTHRLLSEDIAFKDLGLAIIDEEQRFGVKHKERFKEMFRQIDVLTLSATPIPRTLYMALMGARDMSTIDTPPPNRVPVHTSVTPYDERIIRDAIRRELARGGQVFFLHNRVKSIEVVRKRLTELVPEARILVGHGQMEKDELEIVMRRFVQHEADILLATTIIETGIDIPNANTILIDRADRFGLADLYQLRGRVGRAGEQAYAILLLPRDAVTAGDARKRIHAIKQYTALGSGFRIAMRDLEIRGAGNLLGTKQSGQIAAIGFDLYCQLLRQSIDRLHGKQAIHRNDSSFKADFLVHRESAWLKSPSPDQLPAYLPAAWLDDTQLRVASHREIAEVRDESELDALARRWTDRFGQLPPPVKHLLTLTRIRLIAARCGAASVEIQGQRLMIHRNGDYILLEGKRFPRLTATRPEAKLTETVKLLRSI